MDKREKFRQAISNDWFELLGSEQDKHYWTELENALAKRIHQGERITPAKDKIFNAFTLCRPKEIKVVILGQDPYPHEAAHGLSFSSLHKKTPASLRNIFIEIERTHGQLTRPWDNDLTRWAFQGVFLLNTLLTTEWGRPNAHKGMGWEYFTGRIINLVSVFDQPIVWMLWGKQASVSFDAYSGPNKKHLILRSAHPSPMSVTQGFRGNSHFMLADEFHRSHGVDVINWNASIEDLLPF